MYFKLFLKTSDDRDSVIFPDSIFKFFSYYCKKIFLNF